MSDAHADAIVEGEGEGTTPGLPAGNRLESSAIMHTVQMVSTRVADCFIHKKEH